MPMIIDLDQKLTSVLQSGYDYVRDRWDVYLATYRAFLGSLVVLYGIVIPVLISSNSPAVKLAVISVMSIAFYYVAIRRHVEVEWDLQYDGHDNVINAHGLREQEHALSRYLSTLFVIVINVGFVSPSPAYVITNVIASVCFVAYLWSRCVLIRERDMDRFSQGDLVDSMG